MAIRIKFINQDGNGFCDHITIPDNQSLLDVLTSRGITDPSRYNISVNGSMCTPEQVVRDGDRVAAILIPGRGTNGVVQEADRVTVTPKNIAGALIS